MDFTEKYKKTINKYQGIIVTVRVDKAEMPNGAEVLREVVEHPGGVTVLAVDDDGYAYCVRQYRYAYSEVLLEAPAGKLEKGEDPGICAERELSEETGIKADEIISLGSIYPSPGFSSEVLHLYLARKLTFKEAHPDENEIVQTEKIHFDDLEEMVLSGEIKDAKTVIAVCRARKYIGRGAGE